MVSGTSATILLMHLRGKGPSNVIPITCVLALPVNHLQVHIYQWGSVLTALLLLKGFLTGHPCCPLDWQAGNLFGSFKRLQRDTQKKASIHLCACAMLRADSCQLPWSVSGLRVIATLIHVQTDWLMQLLFVYSHQESLSKASRILQANRISLYEGHLL